MEFDICSPEELVAVLDQKTGLIGLLRQVSPSGGCFDEHYLAPIIDVAAYVLNLPACPFHHADPGGLLRHAAQSAYYAMRLADGAVFGGTLSAEERRLVGLDSRRAAFLAALASPIYMPHRYLSVCSMAGECWTESSAEPLYSWVSARDGRYTVRWLGQPAEHVRTLAAWLVGNLLSKHWVGIRHDVMVAAMASIAPEDKPTGQEGPLQKIVRQALAKSVETAKRAIACNYIPTETVIPSSDQIESAILVPAAVENVAASLASTHLALEAKTKYANTPTQQVLELPGMDSPTNPLAGVSPAIRELFEALAEDIRTDERVRARVRWDDAREGLLMDPRLIDRYGMSGTGVASALKKAKLAFDGGHSRSLLLAASIGDFLLPRTENVNR